MDEKRVAMSERTKRNLADMALTRAKLREARASMRRVQEILDEGIGRSLAASLDDERKR